MKLLLSHEMNTILSISRDEAIRTGCYEIEPDHIVLGIIRHQDNDAYRLLKDFNIDIELLKQSIDATYAKNRIIPFEEMDKVSFSKSIEAVIKYLSLLTHTFHTKAPTPAHLLLSIIKCSKSVTRTFLRESGVTADRIMNTLYPSEERSETAETPLSSSKKGDSNSPLELYGIDLTKCAKGGKLDPVVGRDREVERLAQILCRRRKNNPILIGEAGVGKSSIVEGLAIRIANKTISKGLLNKKIISLDIGSIVAGTKYRGQFEERIKSIINEIKSNPNIILFIDEIHTIVGAGSSSGSLDAANLLKPALSRGEIQCIGATTLDEFREIVERDGALERRFQKVLVEPTSFEDTLDILQGIKERYELHHKVEYTDEAIRSCIALSNRYITDRCLPDKAIDAMDEAGAMAHISTQTIPNSIVELETSLNEIREKKRGYIESQNFLKASEIATQEKELKEKHHNLLNEWLNRCDIEPVEITPKEIAYVISMMTGIPTNRVEMSEGQKLISMEKILKKRIVGQDEAIEKVAKAVRRNRAGLGSPNKPIGTFLFLGPTGVGKTQLAKEIANFLFDSKDNIIRVDMSEYMEKYSITRLIGSPPGYVGYKEGGQLTEMVRRKPYSVVLIDEIEKAHPDIYNLLLQVLDEGRLTDSNGNYINFRNTIVILTTNVGSRELKEFGRGVGYLETSHIDSQKKNQAIVNKALDKTFNPEFINRLDDMIFFNSLTMEDIERIIEIELEELYMRVNNSGYTLKIDKRAKKFIAQAGFDPKFGARPLKRAIQQYVEDVVAEAILSDTVKVGDTISLGLNKGKDGVVILPK